MFVETDVISIEGHCFSVYMLDSYTPRPGDKIITLQPFYLGFMRHEIASRDHEILCTMRSANPGNFITAIPKNAYDKYVTDTILGRNEIQLWEKAVAEGRWRRKDVAKASPAPPTSSVAPAHPPNPQT